MTINLWIVKCRKCGRDVDINDLLLREGRCSPKDWGRCIRDPLYYNEEGILTTR